jgi:hypothetical protein
MVDGHSFGYIFVIAKNGPRVSQVGNMAYLFILFFSNEDKTASGSSFSRVDAYYFFVDSLA